MAKATVFKTQEALDAYRAKLAPHRALAAARVKSIEEAAIARRAGKDPIDPATHIAAAHASVAATRSAMRIGIAQVTSTRPGMAEAIEIFLAHSLPAGVTDVPPADVPVDDEVPF